MTVACCLLALLIPKCPTVSGKVTSRPGAAQGTRTLPRPGHKLAPPPSSGMSRSSSVGVLNQVSTLLAKILASKKKKKKKVFLYTDFIS
jgi:hypothetical protein